MNDYKVALSPKAFKKQLIKKIGHDNLFSWGNEKGIKRWVIETIQKGKVPKYEHLVGIANALNVSIDWLLTGKEPEPGIKVGESAVLYGFGEDVRAISKALVELHAKDEKEYKKAIGIINRLLDIFYDDIGGEERKRQTKGLRKTG